MHSVSSSSSSSLPPSSPSRHTFSLRPDAPIFVPPHFFNGDHHHHDKHGRRRRRPDENRIKVPPQQQEYSKKKNHNDHHHQDHHRVTSPSRRHRPRRRPSVIPQHHHHNNNTNSSSPRRNPRANSNARHSRQRPLPPRHIPPLKRLVSSSSSLTSPPVLVHDNTVPEPKIMDTSGIHNFPTLPSSSSSSIVLPRESPREKKVWSQWLGPPAIDDDTPQDLIPNQEKDPVAAGFGQHLVILRRRQQPNRRHSSPHPHTTTTDHDTIGLVVHPEISITATTTTTTVVHHHHQNDEKKKTNDVTRNVVRPLRMDQLRDRWWKLVRDYQYQHRDPDLKNDDTTTTNVAHSTTTTNAHSHSQDNYIQHSIVLTPPEEIPVSRSSSSSSTTRDNNTDNDTNEDEDDENDYHESEPFTTTTTSDTPIDPYETLSAAVRFNQASKLRSWCRRSMMMNVGSGSGGRSSSKSSSTTTTTTNEAVPLLMAVELGHDECVQILLSYFGISSLLTCRDTQGNTALHTSCGSTAHRTTFSILLDSIITSTGYTKSLLFKLMSSRNHQQQTPLHVAGQCQRSDVMDLILSHRGTSNLSLLTKLLSITDQQGQTPFLAAVAANATDVVMSLQMWRGHHHPPSPFSSSLLKSAPLATTAAAGVPHSKHYHYVNPTNPQQNGDPRCPLAWAVQHHNIDMVALLLEFNNPSSESGYRLNHALRVAVIQEAHGIVMENDNDNDDDADADDDSIILDMIRILVAAGANPCVIDADEDESSTALSLASLHGKPERLARLWHSHDEYLCRIRRQRRQDPKLQRQPESFFIGMESTEQSERQNAAKEALLISLSLIRSGSHTTRMNRHGKCCLVLYEQGIQLGPSDLVQLQHSMNLNVMTKPQYPASCERIRPPCGASTTHDTTHQGEYDDSYWSRVLSTLPWFESSHTSKCACFTSAQRRTEQPPPISPPDVILVCHDGTSLLAHQVVLNQRSQKLAAALRFAAMAHQGHGEDTILLTTETETATAIITLEMDLPYDICRQLLIHMYHGSLLLDDDDWPVDKRYECGEQLLALVLVGDEYICPTLTCECVNRLLASVDAYDRCMCGDCCQNAVLETKEQNYVRYPISGPPSHLITAELALDILAVAQQIHGSLDGSIVNNDSVSCNNTTKQSIRSKRTLVDDLREITLLVAIGDFATVWQRLEKDETESHPNNTALAANVVIGEELLTRLVNDLRDIGRLVK